ncbi:urease accessory protein UreF [Chitinophaga nivalis]|uniref:Urease accessory protein UreF n=1 Tax=Chitinophaga nivalis TaxID=2991709 RepID=A0ABT3IGZ2_9BACT|nr:urease accessory protein UreF [Chitinophaga nivalis]MCW3467269.1 urease accessory protein UreF [Chitinophaga nivalis]MCW3483039.1 urease accessory protein UreF [Chitinophaga nivalis]
MKHPFLGHLLQLSDPTLPIGGYSHSNGLETYVQEGMVKDVATAHAYVQQMLTANLQYNDAAFVCLAYTATTAASLPALLTLDEEVTALKLPREIREASQKLGIRLMKVFNRQQSYPLAIDFTTAVQQKKTAGHYCIAYGMYACLLGIPLPEALFAFYYNAAVGMITNAVKLVPLGQLDGQDILFALQPVMQQLVENTLQLDRELVGICNIGFDIRCMQHERLYTRLYMS